MKIDVTTLDAKKAGSVELSDSIYGLDVRKDILHRMVTYQLAKRRQGTHQTKTRGEVKTTKHKLGNQKGGGTARHGHKSVPQFRGGAKAFGPRSRDHAIDLPKKVRLLALKHALSAKKHADQLVVLDEAKSKEPKTKGLKVAFDKLGWGNALIVDGGELDKNFQLAARNIPNIDVLPIQGINVYDILKRDNLVLTKAAVDQLEARFA